MLRLSLNVRNGFFDVRDADTECAITFLPGKATMLWESFMHKFRRAAFDQLHRFSDWQGRGQREKHVNVIGDAADSHRLHPVFFSDAADERPESFLHLR